MADLSSNPARLNLTIYHGRTDEIVLAWPAGVLDGRGPWQATVTGPEDGDVDPIDLPVTVAGDVMTLDVPALDKALKDVTLSWELADDGRPIIAGRFTVSTLPGPSTIEASVTIDEQTVTVQLVGGLDSAPVESVNGETGEVVLDAADVGADPADSAATVQTALDTHEADLEVHRPPSARVDWFSASDWDQLTVVPVTNISPGDIILTAVDGQGTAQGDGAHGSDRRIFLIDDFPDDATDVEMRVQVALSTTDAQVGLAMRVDQVEGLAVIVWTNVVFGQSGNLLQGVWDWVPPGTGGTLATNGGPDICFMTRPVLSAEADGSTATVQTVTPHGIRTGDFVDVTSPAVLSGSKAATVVDATTFTTATTQTGSWPEGGRFNIGTFTYARWLAVRLVGDRVTFKQWGAHESEPSWHDPLRAETNVLPATLGSTGEPPPAAGPVGLVIAHLGAARAVTVNDLHAKQLT